MASWTDDLLPASFRGISFFVEQTSLQGGRSVVNHEFPERDEPFSEDTGRKQKVYPITGHVLGDDLKDQRERLERAFDQKGPGQLVHPYYGVIRVQIEGYEFTDDTLEGRITKFSLTFFEAGSFRFPSLTEDKKATLLTSTSSALDAAKESFSDKFSIVNQPGFLVDSARAKLLQATSAIDSAKSVVTEISNAAAELSFSIRQLESDIDTLMATPGALADRLLGSLSLLTNLTESKSESSRAYRTLSDFGNDTEVFPTGTPTREQQQNNDDTINEYIQTIALIRESEDISDVELTSFQDAIDSRESIIGLIDSKLEDENISDDLYMFLAQTKSSLIDLLPDIDANLPDEVEFTPIETTSSLLLAYALYQDAEREQDIIERNKIQHPGFIPGGKPLEIIT